MSMPVNFNPQKRGPIEVLQDDTHYLVRIHPENKDRAKKIPERQWDGNRKAWVYPKSPSTYDALLEEFQKDADSFDIGRRPKTKRPPGIKPPIKTVDDNEFDEQFLENIRSIEDIGESQEKMYGELEQIREMLGSLRDVAANQSRLLEEVRGTQEQTATALVKLEKPSQKITETEKVQVLPSQLDLSKQKEVELLEKALVLIACQTARNSRSFHEWVNQHKPLREPSGFVIKTHEFLKNQLAQLVGDDNPHTKFHKLISKARDDKLIYRDEKNPADRPISTLFTLNEHRNCFGHPSFDQWEEWCRSILYLINLSMVWSRVVIEEGISDE